MTPTPDSTLHHLRDVILLEADWLQARARWLNLVAKRHGAPELNTVAGLFRDRARDLHEALAASEPKAEAS